MIGELWLRRIGGGGAGVCGVCWGAIARAEVPSRRADWGGKGARVRKCRAWARSEHVRTCRAELGARDNVSSGVRNTFRCFSCRDFAQTVEVYRVLKPRTPSRVPPTVAARDALRPGVHRTCPGVTPTGRRSTFTVPAALESMCTCSRTDSKPTSAA
jgi:hypothetical protein